VSVQASLADFGADLHRGNVQFYSKHAKELKETHNKKALLFLEYDCVRYVGDDNEYSARASFVVLPLNSSTVVMDMDTGREFVKVPYSKDYNSTIYTITRRKEGFECNCQGWQTRAKREGGIINDGCMCSHTLALFYCFKLKRFGGVRT